MPTNGVTARLATRFTSAFRSPPNAVASKPRSNHDARPWTATQRLRSHCTLAPTVAPLVDDADALPACRVSSVPRVQSTAGGASCALAEAAHAQANRVMPTRMDLMNAPSFHASRKDDTCRAAESPASPGQARHHASLDRLDQQQVRGDREREEPEV